LLGISITRRIPGNYNSMHSCIQYLKFN